MKRRELRQCMEQLAEEYEFRWTSKAKRFLGLHRGIVIEMFEWDGEIKFVFSSPLAQIGDQLLEEFTGFTHLAEAGIPTSWVRGLMQRDDSGHESACDSGCRLSIDSDRMDSIGIDTFLRLPDILSEEFHAHGAADTVLCAGCHERDATTVGLLKYTHTPLCDGCWQDLQFRTSGGRLAVEQSVNWLRVVPMLLALTALGGLVWGFLQQPQRLDRMGLLSLLLPAAWAYGLCCSICFFASGVTRTLRLSIFVSVVVSVLAGNIWGFRSFVRQQLEEQGERTLLESSWVDSIGLYFTALPTSWPGELPFLLAGLVGAWIGLKTLKGEETIDVQ